MAGNLLGGPAPQSARERFPSPRLSAGVRAQREKAEPQTCPLPCPPAGGALPAPRGPEAGPALGRGAGSLPGKPCSQRHLK